jgi:hypothetical protein
MLGPEGVAVLISGYLHDTTPGIVDRLAGELGPPEEPPVDDPADTDPAAAVLTARPVLFASTELAVDTVGMDDWPFVITTAATMKRMRRTDVLPGGGIVYSCTYPMRVVAWVRGDGFHSTARIRDRLILAIRESLLLDQTAGDPRFAVDETTWVERYSDVDRDADLEVAQTVAAASADFEVTVSETLTPMLPANPPATEVDLDTQRLPAHPAL